MNVVRRALAAAAISGTALAGVATVGATAAQASVRVPTHLSIKVATGTVTYGMTDTVTGKLTYTRHHHRHALANATVWLQERVSRHSPWRKVAGVQGTTAQDGTVSITTPALTRTEQVRLLYTGDKTSTPPTRRTHSTVRTIKVRYAVNNATENGTLAAGGATVTATIAPANKGATVVLQFKGSKGWVTRGHAKEVAGGGVTFALTKTNKAGTYRVVKPAGHGLLKGVATVTVS